MDSLLTHIDIKQGRKNDVSNISLPNKKIKLTTNAI